MVLVSGLIDEINQTFNAHGGSSVTFRDPARPCRAGLSSPSRKARRRFARAPQTQKAGCLRNRPLVFGAHGGSSVTFRDPALPCRARLSSPSRKARRRFARGRQNAKGRLLAQPTFFILVPTEGLEPPHLAAHGPEPCASTNSATWASLLAVCCCSDCGEPELYRTCDRRSMPAGTELALPDARQGKPR